MAKETPKPDGGAAASDETLAVLALLGTSFAVADAVALCGAVSPLQACFDEGTLRETAPGVGTFADAAERERITAALPLSKRRRLERQIAQACGARCATRLPRRAPKSPRARA